MKKNIRMYSNTMENKEDKSEKTHESEKLEKPKLFRTFADNIQRNPIDAISLGTNFVDKKF